VTRATPFQPSCKGIADVFGLACGDEFAGEVHARRHGITSENLCCHGLARQPRFALETLTDFDDTCNTSGANIGQMSSECDILELEFEPDHVQCLIVPAARNFDARHMLQAQVDAGGTRLETALQGVVIGQCRVRHAAARAKFDHCCRRQHAIGMMAVHVQVGDKGRTHHRYDKPMSLAAHQAPSWGQIDTVLLDLDGTLLDLAFDNFIWLARVAEIYAEKQGLSLAETHAELVPRFQRVQGTLEWYSIEYWSAHLGIDIARVHREEAHRVAWLPGARGFLERVRERGKRLVLMTNSHPTILEIKNERTGVLAYLDAAYTSHSFGAPKEDQRFWQAARATETFDPARTMFVDDSKAVLHAAIEHGIRWVYGVKRPDSSREPHHHEEFAAIDHVADLG